MLESKEKTAVKKATAHDIDPVERQKMIAEAAYYRAKAKAFSDSPEADWLEAEKEIDRKLADQGRSTMKKEEVAAFDKLRFEVSRILGGIQDTVKADAFRNALEKGILSVKEMGQYTSESIGKGSEALKKDIARNIDRYRGTWHTISEKTPGFFSVWKDRSAHFLKQAEEAAESWLKQLHEKKNPHLYHTGELTSAGTFVCGSCGFAFDMEESCHLPRCPKCAAKEFTRET